MKARYTDAGVHLFDRQTGLNILLDEIKIDLADRAEAPRYLSIALTNACDLRCSYCYAPKQVGAHDVEVIRQWAVDLDHAGCLGVGFGGGEPTLHPRFAELCRSISETTSLAVTFTTHGHRLDDELVDSLRGAVHFVRLSVDGVGATYERLRGRSFADVHRAAGLLRGLGPFGVNVVVNHDTIAELDQIASFAADVGAIELLLLPQQRTAREPGITEADQECLLGWIRAARPGVQLALSQTGLETGVPTAEPIPGETPLQAHMHIDAFGTLRANAFAPTGVQVGSSILNAVRTLRKAAA